MTYERQPDNITDESLNKAIEACKQLMFKRAVGFIMQDDSIKVVSDKFSSDLSFDVDLQDVKCLFYTIVNNATYPNIDEMQLQNKFKIPFCAISLDQDKELIDCFFWGSLIIPKLVGRPYRAGTMDCYALIRDFYKLYFDIYLPDYPRDNRAVIGEKGYIDCLLQEDFELIRKNEAEPGDILCGCIAQRKVVNHGGIVLSDNRILHQLAGKNSEIISTDKKKNVFKYCLRRKNLDSEQRALIDL
jgi:hypothetical protein